MILPHDTACYFHACLMLVFYCLSASCYLMLLPHAALPHATYYLMLLPHATACLLLLPCLMLLPHTTTCY